jgi:hypothetical protein
MPGFYDYFKENMDGLGMPVPDSLFGTASSAAAAGLALQELRDIVGDRVTFADLRGAGTATEKWKVLGGIVVAAYLGAVIGSLAVATGRVLSGGTSIADVMWDIWGSNPPANEPDWWPSDQNYGTDEGGSNEGDDDIGFSECFMVYQDAWSSVWDHSDYSVSGRLIAHYEHEGGGFEGSSARIGNGDSGSLLEALTGNGVVDHTHSGHSHSPAPKRKPSGEELPTSRAIPALDDTALRDRTKTSGISFAAFSVGAATAQEDSGQYVRQFEESIATSIIHAMAVFGSSNGSSALDAKAMCSDRYTENCTFWAASY